MDMLSEQWDSTIENIVMESLAIAKITNPPVDTGRIASALGFEIVRDETQSIRGRHKSVAQKSVLFIKPDVRPERLHWAVAHEIGEAIAYQVFEAVGIPLDDPDAPSREQIANRLASQLLLPTIWFQELCRDSDDDLFVLKNAFATASHELIAMRWLDFPDAVVVTILDNGQITRRISNGSYPGRRLLPPEKDVWQTCHDSGEPKEFSDAESNLRVRCWPVHEENWKREIIRITPLEDFE